MSHLSPGDTRYEGSRRIKQYDDHYVVHDGSWTGGRYNVHEHLGRHDGFYKIPEPAKKQHERTGEQANAQPRPPTYKEWLLAEELHESKMRDAGEEPRSWWRR